MEFSGAALEALYVCYVRMYVFTYGWEGGQKLSEQANTHPIKMIETFIQNQLNTSPACL
jgi:hypothetical protein